MQKIILPNRIVNQIHFDNDDNDLYLRAVRTDFKANCIRTSFAHVYHGNREAEGWLSQ